MSETKPEFLDTSDDKSTHVFSEKQKHKSRSNPRSTGTSTSKPELPSGSLLDARPSLTISLRVDLDLRYWRGVVLMWVLTTSKKMHVSR